MAVPLSKKCDLITHLMAGASFREAVLAAGIARQTAFRVIVDVGTGLADAPLPSMASAQQTGEAVDVTCAVVSTKILGVEHTVAIALSCRTFAAIGYAVAPGREDALTDLKEALGTIGLSLRIASFSGADPLFPRGRMYWCKRVETLTSITSMVCTDHNLSRVGDDSKTPAMREGLTHRPWATEEWLGVALSCAAPPTGAPDAALSSREATRRSRAKYIGTLPVFGKMLPVGDLAKLAGREPGSILARMRLYPMSPEQAAFGE